jgi:hypothetical protein
MKSNYSLFFMLFMYSYVMSYTTCLANDPRDRRDRDCKLVGFTTTYAIGAYHHQRCVFELRSVVLDTTLFDEVCQ